MNSTRLWRLHAAIVLATFADAVMRAATKLGDVGPPPPCTHEPVLLERS